MRDSNGNPTLDVDLSIAKMIVFDKDGTLGDDKASLKRWACQMTDRIEETIMGIVHNAQHNNCDPLRQVLWTEFHNQIGWDPIRQTVLPSAPLAAGTWEEQVTTLQTLLNKYQLDDTGMLAAKWHSQIELHSADNPVIPNLRGLLLDCRNRGLRITVCTSDERHSTDQALQNWKVQDIISDSICGDEVDKPKPNAEPLERLCRRGGVTPQECIVVGDTISDVGMARNAKALFCIGVLTGSGTAEQLTAMGANIVLPSVEHIPELLSACGLVHVLEGS